MLERATAGLKAGACDSFRYSTQHVSRSRRRLHSTFWDHGASDLDLSALAIPLIPARAHINSESIPSLSSNTKNRRVAAISLLPPHDRVFLDFLYPPQALAWLCRTEGRTEQSWGRRSTRRLPNGFSRSSRGYSSRSPVKITGRSNQDGYASANRDTAAFEHISEGGHNSRNDVQKETFRELPDTVSKIVSMSTHHQPENGLTAVDFARRQSLEGLCADSPGDLAEGNPEDKSHNDSTLHDPLPALRGLLAGQRPARGQDTTSRAWSLYNTLSEAEKNDTRLKSEMLVWLIAQDSTNADAHCISLYWSLPLSERPLPVYQAALTALLRCNDLDSALGLHKEALSNIPNGDQITKELFKFVIERGDIQTAIKIKNQHHSAISGMGQARPQAIFWLNVAKIPNLIDIANRLVIKCRKLYSQEPIDEEYLRFSAKISEEALNQLQEIQFSDTQLPQSTLRASTIYRLINAIHQWSPNATETLETSIASMLQQNESERDYERVHHLICGMYRLYRQADNAKLPEHLLMLFLMRLIRYSRGLERDQEGRHSISLELLVHDWELYHGKLSQAAICELISFSAITGNSDKVNEYFDYLSRHHPRHGKQADLNWTLIYVHARRVDLPMALQAFQKLQQTAKTNDKQIDLKCWNSLLHAQSRADDLNGALSTLRDLLDSGAQPDDSSFHPITEMYARRGDIKSVEALLEQYDHLSGQRRSTSLIGSLMNAHINAGNVESAQRLLQITVEQVLKGEVRGSLTTCFNILIVTFALHRNVDGTMHAYRWMKARKIFMNAFTYSALMQALTRCRQTPAAHKLMTSIMPREGFKPVALHFAILMAGYTNQQMYKEALAVYHTMVRQNIKPSLATKRAHLKARALYEQETQKQKNIDAASGKPTPLETVINELKEALAMHDGSELAAKQPAFGYDISGRSGRSVMGEYFNSIMFIHGSRRCLKAVEEMFQLYQSTTKEEERSPEIPMRIITALMLALFHAKKYDDVEDYWTVAKHHADKFTPTAILPDFRPKLAEDEDVPQLARHPIDARPREDSAAIDRGEIGFAVNGGSSLQERRLPRPSPGREHILTRPLRYYLRALAKQQRHGHMIKTFVSLLGQGYAVDIITWNRFIEYLCTAQPPLVLFAFWLTERYLMPGWPGWTRQTKYIARRGARIENLQYIRARYLESSKLMPQYRTMLHLAAALLRLRNTESIEGLLRKRDKPGLWRLVGDEQKVRKKAPKTFQAVESMPRIDEKLQNAILGEYRL